LYLKNCYWRYPPRGQICEGDLLSGPLQEDISVISTHINHVSTGTSTLLYLCLSLSLPPISVSFPPSLSFSCSLSLSLSISVIISLSLFFFFSLWLQSIYGIGLVIGNNSNFFMRSLLTTCLEINFVNLDLASKWT